MAITREQAMSMLFAPPWAPGTYDDATVWNDAHRQMVPKGVPVGSRDAIAQELMQQQGPQANWYSTGDTNRYPDGGGLGGEQPGYPDNPNLDLGQTSPQAPGPFSGVQEPPAPDVPPVGQPVGQPTQAPQGFPVSPPDVNIDN